MKFIKCRPKDHEGKRLIIYNMDYFRSIGSYETEPGKYEIYAWIKGEDIHGLSSSDFDSKQADEIMRRIWDALQSGSNVNLEALEKKVAKLTFGIESEKTGPGNNSKENYYELI
jgi:hypothetical protein